MRVSAKQGPCLAKTRLVFREPWESRGSLCNFNYDAKLRQSPVSVVRIVRLAYDARTFRGIEGVFSRLSQVFGYEAYLPWGEALGGFLVARGKQLCHEGLASVYPRHEVVDG